MNYRFLSLFYFYIILDRFGTSQQNPPVTAIRYMLKTRNVGTCGDDTIGSCCNANLPKSCRALLANNNVLDGKSCRDVILFPECTQCCTELHQIGWAKSANACCPKSGCGNSIGCEPVGGTCGCRDLSYFIGQIEQCTVSGGACRSFDDCCAGLGCIGGICAKCYGRNFPCSGDSNVCCGSDICVNNSCVACSSVGTSCYSNADCSCDFESCIDGVCQSCYENQGNCTYTSDCCWSNAKLAFCSPSPYDSGPGKCTWCMSPDQTPSESLCISDDNCCGDNICIDGICKPCLLENMRGCQEDADCCEEDPDSPDPLMCANGICQKCSSLAQDGEYCDENRPCCNGFCQNGYCQCVPPSNKCSEGSSSECCSDSICVAGYCCLNNIGDPCEKPSDCCLKNMLYCQPTTYTCQLITLPTEDA